MKQIVLIRHAEAENSYLGGSDFDRDLTTEGITHAIQLGRELNTEGLEVDKLIFSTAQRTKETTRYISELLNLSEEKLEEAPSIYNASVGQLYEMIQGLDNTMNSVVLVGHNPAISYLAEYLTEEFYSFVPASAVAIELDVEEWNHIVKGFGTIKFTKRM
ncbi:SixA phosphatase family protein [Sediminitomix flava]|uniref:Phosphohistidine phosphatase n=1 Tax=Sediminitomix flava TaxID=379075 RepID=A0A315ZEZ9_SEDFL|nr:histidine phosphatase family protein [Sediminitomix flava]PWJ43902.1 phosphohistidine phosphatase [Sediminitomix flava]